MVPAGLSQTVSESRIWRYLLSAFVGALIGVVISFTVNCTLVEISINGFFAWYFGLLFILIAGILLWRVRTGDHPKPWLLAGFSVLVLLSGCVCFVLEAQWFTSLSPGAKVPLYSVLGVSLCFALLFSIIDLMNYCTGVCSCCRTTKALIETETQVYLVVATAMLMGFVFGFIFGLMDVEDEKIANIKVALLREESICYPIGAVMGAISATINQWLTENRREHHYDPVSDTNLDDDF